MAKDLGIGIELGVVTTGLIGLKDLSDYLKKISEDLGISSDALNQFSNDVLELVRQGRDLVDAFKEKSKILGLSHEQLTVLLEDVKKLNEQYTDTIRATLQLLNVDRELVVQYHKHFSVVSPLVRFLDKYSNQLRILAGDVATTAVRYLSLAGALELARSRVQSANDLFMKHGNLLLSAGQSTERLSILVSSLQFKLGTTTEAVQNAIEGLLSYSGAVLSANESLESLAEQVILTSQVTGIAARDLGELEARLLGLYGKGQITSKTIANIGDAIIRFNVEGSRVVNLLKEFAGMFSVLNINIVAAARGVSILESALSQVGLSAKMFLEIGRGLVSVTGRDYPEALTKAVMLSSLMRTSLEQTIKILQGKETNVKVVTQALKNFGSYLSENRAQLGMWGELLGWSSEVMEEFAGFGKKTTQEIERQVVAQQEARRWNALVAESWKDLSKVTNVVVGTISLFIKVFEPILTTISKAFLSVVGAIRELEERTRGWIKVGYVLIMVGGFYTLVKAGIMVRQVILSLKLAFQEMMMAIQQANVVLGEMIKRMNLAKVAATGLSVPTVGQVMRGAFTGRLGLGIGGLLGGMAATMAGVPQLGDLLTATFLGLSLGGPWGAAIGLSLGLLPWIVGGSRQNTQQNIMDQRNLNEFFAGPSINTIFTR